MRKFFTHVISILSGAAFGYLAFHCYHKCPSMEIVRYVTSTIVKTDTLVMECTVPVYRELTGRSVAASNDSVSVRLPEERAVYSDSSFRAVVSGIRPRLDSLTIFPRHEITTVAIPRPRPSPRWGLGVTAGATLTPRGISPGISIGVTYNFVTF